VYFARYQAPLGNARPAKLGLAKMMKPSFVYQRYQAELGSELTRFENLWTDIYFCHSY
jgi:hypothetical protein